MARDTSASEELRKEALHNLGITDGAASRAVLLDVYRSENAPELKRQVLHSLFLQDAVDELVTLARSEPDVGLKKQAVHWLSLMDTPESKEFMMEILRQ